MSSDKNQTYKVYFESLEYSCVPVSAYKLFFCLYFFSLPLITFLPSQSLTLSYLVATHLLFRFPFNHQFVLFFSGNAFQNPKSDIFPYAPTFQYLLYQIACFVFILHQIINFYVIVFVMLTCFLLCSTMLGMQFIGDGLNKRQCQT